MKIYSVALLFLAWAVFSCTTKESTQNEINRLHDIWALESIEGKIIAIDETIKSIPVLEIYVKEKRIHGNTSCNIIEGKVEINNSIILFSDIITTKMACTGDLEQRFLYALQKVNNYKIEKLKLYLYKDDKELLSLKKID